MLLPKSFVDRPDFGKTMSSLQALIKAENPIVLRNKISEYFSEEEKRNVTIMDSIKKLSEDLISLHINKWDGIWIRIITNFMMIARLQKHDLIVGNPPWVKWEHLPAAYTKKIKKFCDIRHIFCNDGMYGGAQLNICALISNVSATNWLKKNGVLAFLMPDSLMSQNSYEEFRNFYVSYENKERLYLQKLDKWCAPLRPFKVGTKSVTQDFNTYYYSNHYVDYKQGVKVRAISKKTGVSDLTINNCLTFEDAEQYLVINELSAKQMASNSTQFTYISGYYDFSSIIGETSYLYRTGVESTPFEIFKMLGAGTSQIHGHYRFKNKVLKTSKYKVDDIPQEGWDFPVELLYPMVEGPAIKPFSFDCGNNFHLIPYDRNNTVKPITLEKLTNSNEEIALYFCNHKNLLDQQSDKSKTMHQGEEFYALSKIGPYTFAPYIVAARDNSNFCSSVISPVLTPWGEIKHTICVKHTIIISQDVNKNFITEDESHYINAILNSSIVHAYIHATFKTNGFSLKKSNLCIPKFDALNPLHNKLVRMSKIASKPENKDKREYISKLLSTLYVDVCNEFKSQKCIKEYVLINEHREMVAEPAPFENFSWKNFNNTDVNIVGEDDTILIGCYKNKKHHNWIIENGIYNIRLGNRLGSVDEERPCIKNASLLILYDIKNLSKIYVYRIKAHKAMTGEDLKKLNYPRKRISKRYMTFEIEPISNYTEKLKKYNFIENLIVSSSNYVKGTPIFLEP